MAVCKTLSNTLLISILVTVLSWTELGLSNVYCLSRSIASCGHKCFLNPVMISGKSSWMSTCHSSVVRHIALNISFTHDFMDMSLKLSTRWGYFPGFRRETIMASFHWGDRLSSCNTLFISSRRRSRLSPGWCFSISYVIPSSQGVELHLIPLK